MNYTQGLVEQFNFVILLATLTTLVPYAYAAAAAAEVAMFITDRDRFSARNLVLDTIVAGLAFAYSVWAIVGVGYEAIALGFILLMLGIPVFLYMRWRRANGPVAEARERVAIELELGARPSH